MLLLNSGWHRKAGWISGKNVYFTFFMLFLLFSICDGKIWKDLFKRWKQWFWTVWKAPVCWLKYKISLICCTSEGLKCAHCTKQKKKKSRPFISFLDNVLSSLWQPQNSKLKLTKNSKEMAIHILMYITKVPSLD